jgi:Tol biopolymer transport system component
MSPDGTRIAYWYRSGAKAGIAVMDANGGNERPLLDRNWTPVKSDLQWISPEEVMFFDGSPKEGKPGLAALNVLSGTVRMLSLGRVARGSWTVVPARNEFVFLPPPPDKQSPAEALSSLAERQLRVRSLADHTERAVTMPGPILNFALSADGRQIAYSTVDQTQLADLEKMFAPVTGDISGPEAAKLFASLMDRTASFEVHIANADGSGDRRLLRADMKSMAIDAGGFDLLGFSPDGRFLLYQPADAPAPRIMDVKTGDNWPIFDKPSASTQWGAATWAADGSLLVTGSSNRTEYRAWEGVTHAAVVKLTGGRR